MSVFAGREKDVHVHKFTSPRFKRQVQPPTALNTVHRQIDWLLPRRRADVRRPEGGDSIWSPSYDCVFHQKGACGRMFLLFCLPLFASPCTHALLAAPSGFLSVRCVVQAFRSFPWVAELEGEKVSLLSLFSLTPLKQKLFFDSDSDGEAMEIFQVAVCWCSLTHPTCRT